MRGAVLAALSRLGKTALKSSSARHRPRAQKSCHEHVGELCRNICCTTCAPDSASAYADDESNGEDDDEATRLFPTTTNVLPSASGAAVGSRSSRGSGDKADYIDYLLLITDGSVDDEREIVADLKPSNVRVLACGIGTFCNGYFLRTLANESRGAFEHALFPAMIAQTIVGLFQGTNEPLLRDIEIGASRVCVACAVRCSVRDALDASLTPSPATTTTSSLTQPPPPLLLFLLDPVELARSYRRPSRLLRGRRAAPDDDSRPLVYI